MKVMLLNPPHTAIGSRVPDEHLPPLGLLAIGGPLVDAGHSVQLLDAEFGPMHDEEIVRQVQLASPQVVMLGHSGSSSAHPTVARLTRSIKKVCPECRIVYGGVFPTFAAHQVLRLEPQIDVVVRGEGEQTAVELLDAWARGAPIDAIPGITFRKGGEPTDTGDRPPVENLDDYRIGWELIDHARYRYWGNHRAVVVQFSRGCPHRCSYCGQRGFWRKWRHRDPKRFAAELAYLHRQHGVKVFNFADENPTASREAWKAFLEALVQEDIDVKLVGSTRADDIVRDADLLPLYRQAGVERFLLGIESSDARTLEKIHKDGSTSTDREAIRLLRRHGILSMATYVVGFEEERDRDYLAGLRRLLSYDPDQIQLLYVTPHHWTPLAGETADRRVIQTDLRLWDYKHQVLATRHVPPWRVLLWVKFIEVVMQARPRSIWRLLMHPDREIRAAIRWYYRIGRRVWLYEIRNFIRERRTASGPTLARFHARDQYRLPHTERDASPPGLAPECKDSHGPGSTATPCIQAV